MKSLSPSESRYVIGRLISFHMKNLADYIVMVHDGKLMMRLHIAEIVPYRRLAGGTTNGCVRLFYVSTSMIIIFLSPSSLHACSLPPPPNNNHHNTYHVDV